MQQRFIKLGKSSLRGYSSHDNLETHPRLYHQPAVLLLGLMLNAHRLPTVLAAFTRRQRSLARQVLHATSALSVHAPTSSNCDQIANTDARRLGGMGPSGWLRLHWCRRLVQVMRAIPCVLLAMFYCPYCLVQVARALVMSISCVLLLMSCSPYCHRLLSRCRVHLCRW